MSDALVPLRGRTALVTGASRGIGLAVSKTLAAAGARVVMLARGADALHARAAEIGRGALSFPCDVGLPDDVERLLASLRHESASVDILVNNAGLFPLARVDDTSVDEFARTLEVNLVGPFRLLRACLPEMRSRGSGHVVTIGSIADRETFPENGAYAASKFGARALHQVLRMELKGSGIRATLISPGPVDTPLWDPVDPDNRAGFTRRSAMLAPDAVADAVLFALTRSASVNVDELRLSRS